METNFTPKNAGFYCDYCDFKCSKKSDWKRHIETIKHAYRHNGNTLETKKTPQENGFFCNCGKKYGTRAGLWKHSKTCLSDFNCNSNNFKECTNTNTSSNTNDSDTNDTNNTNEKISEFKITPTMFYDLLKQNNELQKNLIELASKQVIGNNNIINSQNKTFNLQFFLNETCKDALSITDFIDQLNITIQDLEETGRLGYAEGMSKVFIKNLKDIDYTKRPIHCSDIKRETLYIKDEDKWEKDDDKKSFLTKAIKQVTNKNITQIRNWQKLNPEYNNPDSKQNDKYMKIILNSMSGSTVEECEKNYEKIVKNIAKETIIIK